MKTMAILILVGLANIAAPVFGAESAKAKDGGKMAMPMSKEDRQKMAEAHEKMAACLKSDTDMKECHEALHKECKATMGDSCGGMEMGKHHHKGM